jgi:hypothetical protein
MGDKSPKVKGRIFFDLDGDAITLTGLHVAFGETEDGDPNWIPSSLEEIYCAVTMERMRSAAAYLSERCDVEAKEVMHAMQLASWGNRAPLQKILDKANFRYLNGTDVISYFDSINRRTI